MTEPAKFLTREEEHDLAIAWRDRRDERAMHKLVLAFMPMVRKSAGKFRGFETVEQDDLEQEGVSGLIAAAEKFNPDLGYRFSTFARHYVHAWIQDFILRSYSSVNHPRHADGRRAFTERKLLVSSVSIDTKLPSGDTLSDLMEDDCPRPDELAGVSIDGERQRAQMMAAVETLPAREKTIIHQRWLLEEPATLVVLADQLGISKERVRQLETRAIQMIRAKLSADRSLPVGEAANSDEAPSLKQDAVAFTKPQYPLSPMAEVLLSYFTGFAPLGYTFEVPSHIRELDIPEVGKSKQRFAQLVNELVGAGCVRRFSRGVRSSGVISVVKRLEQIAHRPGVGASSIVMN